MKKLIPFFLFFFCALAFSGTEVVAPSSGLAYAKVLLVLGFIIGLILLSAWFAKRSGIVGFVNNKNFKVVASLPLGGKEKAVLVKVGRQYLLLGVASGSVSHLQSYLEEDNPLEYSLQESEEISSKTGIDFATQIKKLLTQGQPK